MKNEIIEIIEAKNEIIEAAEYRGHNMIFAKAEDEDEANTNMETYEIDFDALEKLKK